MLVSRTVQLKIKCKGGHNLFVDAEVNTEEAKCNCLLEAEKVDYDEIVEPNRMRTHQDNEGIWHASYVTGNY